MNDGKIRLTFSFTDEYNETTTLDRTYNDCSDIGKLDWLLDEFKYFLRAYGFNESMTNNIVYIEKGEAVIDENGEVIYEYEGL